MQYWREWVFLLCTLFSVLPLSRNVQQGEGVPNDIVHSKMGYPPTDELSTHDVTAGRGGGSVRTTSSLNPAKTLITPTASQEHNGLLLALSTTDPESESTALTEPDFNPVVMAKSQDYAVLETDFLHASSLRSSYHGYLDSEEEDEFFVKINDISEMELEEINSTEEIQNKAHWDGVWDSIHQEHLFQSEDDEDGEPRGHRRVKRLIPVAVAAESLTGLELVREFPDVFLENNATEIPGIRLLHTNTLIFVHDLDENGDKWSMQVTLQPDSNTTYITDFPDVSLNYGETVNSPKIKINGTGTGFVLHYQILNEGYQHITITSSPFDIVEQPIIVKFNSVEARYNKETDFYDFSTDFQLWNFNESRPTNATELEGHVWKYELTLRFSWLFRGHLSGRQTNGKIPPDGIVHLKNLTLTNWGCRYQVVAKVYSDTSDIIINGRSAPLDVEFRIKKTRKRYFFTRTLSVLLNATAAIKPTFEKAMVHRDELLTSFGNTYARRLTVHDQKVDMYRWEAVWSNFSVEHGIGNDALGSVRIQWRVSGYHKDINGTALDLWEQMKKDEPPSTFKVAGNLWQLAQVLGAITIDNEPYYGNDPGPTEPAIRINGISLMHILLGIIMAALIMPVVLLLLCWKKSEKGRLERYQEWLDAEAAKMAPFQRSKKSKSKTTGPTESEPSKDPELDGDHDQEQDQDHVMGVHDSSNPTHAEPLMPAFLNNHTEIGMENSDDPAHFRWSGPDKTGGNNFMELAIGKLDECQKALLDQGSGLSFSRDMITKQNNASQKALSAPVVTSLAKFNKGKGGVSRILVSPVIEPCPLPPGVAIDKNQDDLIPLHKPE